MNTRQRGFTLIELMIVLVIVAILASIAYPSYQQFVRRSARSEAKAALLENAQFLERNFTVANRYDEDSSGDPITDDSLPVRQSPRDGIAKYTMTVDVAGGPLQFVLSAEPIAGTLAENDECGTFTLNQAGVKEVVGATLDAAECWNR